jgi:hypothetical protein
MSDLFEAAREAAQEAVKGYGVGVDKAADAASDVWAKSVYAAVYRRTNIDTAQAVLRDLGVVTIEVS